MYASLYLTQQRNVCILLPIFRGFLFCCLFVFLKYFLWMRLWGTIHDKKADVQLYCICRNVEAVTNIVAQNFGLTIPAVSAKEEKLIQKAVKHLWASALCTRFYGNPAPLLYIHAVSLNNIAIVNREPEKTTLLFWSGARSAWRHTTFTRPTGESRLAPDSNLFSPFSLHFDRLVFVYLLLLTLQALCNIIWIPRMCTCCLFRRRFGLNQ